MSNSKTHYKTRITFKKFYARRVSAQVSNIVKIVGVFKTYFHPAVADKIDSKTNLTDDEKMKFGKIYSIISPNTNTQGTMNIAPGGFTAT